MKRILVWDIPTRLFHALLASSFCAAFAIANLVDDESATFRLHMLFGGIMAFMIVLRIVWGFLGSRWARFGSFMFGPSAVFEYAKGVLTGTGKRHIGHNPGSSWAIFAMLALALGLAVTGANMATGGDVVEEVHEIFAFALLAVVGAHVAGVLVHTWRFRENIVKSMVDGHKEGEPTDAIGSSHAIVGLVFLVMTGAWGYGLIRGYDPATSQVTLPLLGKTVSLGKAEDGASRQDHDEGHDEH